MRGVNTDCRISSREDTALRRCIIIGDKKLSLTIIVYRRSKRTTAFDAYVSAAKLL